MRKRSPDSWLPIHRDVAYRARDIIRCGKFVRSRHRPCWRADGHSGPCCGDYLVSRRLDQEFAISMFHGRWHHWRKVRRPHLN